MASAYASAPMMAPRAAMRADAKMAFIDTL